MWGAISDIIIRVNDADRPFFERPSRFDASAFPVTVDLETVLISHAGVESTACRLRESEIS